MKVYLKGSFIFSILLVGLVLSFLVAAFNYPGRSQQLPLLVAVPTLVMLVLVLIGEWRTRSRHILKYLEQQAVEQKSSVGDEEVAYSHEQRSILHIIAWMFGFATATIVIGFQFSIPLLMFLFLKVRARERWLLSLVLSSVVTGVVLVPLQLLLEVNLFRGLIFGASMPRFW